MTTHRAAWLARAGIVGILVVSGLAFSAGPVAAAGAVNLTVSPGTVSVNAGSTASVQIGIENQSNDSIAKGNMTVQLPSGVLFADGGQSSAGLDCNIQGRTLVCAVNLPAGGRGRMVFQIGAQQGTPNSSQDASVFTSGMAVSGDRSFTINVTGGSQGDVPGVAGTVTDVNTTPVPDANVKVTDSAGKVKGTTTDANGAFVIDARNDPFQSGTIKVEVSKFGFETKSITRTARSGEPITGVALTLAASATPTPTVSPTAAPSEAAPAAAGDQSQISQVGRGDGGLGLLTWILILLGVLLIGGGGLALYFLLRKGKDEDAGPGAPTPTVYGSPPHAGGYDTGAYGPDAVAYGGTTRLMPASADAPTMMHQGPLVPADPYAQPAGGNPYGYQPQGDPRYADPTRAYGSHDAGGYDAGAYGSPPDAGVYGGHNTDHGYARRTDQYGAPADPYAAPPMPTQQFQPYSPAPTGPETPVPPDAYADQTRQFGGVGDDHTRQFSAEPPGQAPGQQRRRPLDWLDD